MRSKTQVLKSFENIEFLNQGIGGVSPSPSVYATPPRRHAHNGMWTVDSRLRRQAGNGTVSGTRVVIIRYVAAQ